MLTGRRRKDRSGGLRSRALLRGILTIRANKHISLVNFAISSSRDYAYPNDPKGRGC